MFTPYYNKKTHVLYWQLLIIVSILAELIRIGETVLSLQIVYLLSFTELFCKGLALITRTNNSLNRDV